MIYVFLISGKAESGKDTVANLIMKNSNCATNYNMHIATSEKRIAVDDFGWDRQKDEKGRALLQMIGDGGRKYNPDIWINKFLRDLDGVLFLSQTKDKTLIVVPDVRYKNEVQKIAKWGEEKGEGVIILTMRVERPNHENSLTEEQRNNSSEVDLDGWGYWDTLLTNDGTLQDLEVAVLNSMEVLGIDY